MDLQAALQDFTTQLRADGRSAHTIGQYRRHVAALSAWLAANKRPDDLAEITPAVLASFFTSDAARVSARGGQKKATSANAMRTSLRNFCRWAHESGFIAANPARLLKRARCTPPAPRGLRADDQERLLRVLGAAAGPEAERDRVLITLLLRTGARLGSAIAMDVADIDFAHSEATLRRMKNNRTCALLLPKALARTMKAFVAGRDGPVFTANGRRLSIRHAQRRIAGWFAAAGIKGSAHALRHSFACDLLARTGNLRVVQDALHHESVLSTSVYARIDHTRLRQVIVG